MYIDQSEGWDGQYEGLAEDYHPIAIDRDTLSCKGHLNI